jgi:hypothetical protein
MDEIEIIKRLAQKAQEEEAPHISVQGRIVGQTARFTYRNNRIFEYLAIGSAVAAALIIIALFLFPTEGDSSAEGIAQFFDQFNNFYSSY